MGLIVDATGRTIEDKKAEPCPRCARGPEQRVPSGGFGETYLVCLCGYEFKELKCRSVTT